MPETPQATDVPLQGEELRERAHSLMEDFKRALSNLPLFQRALTNAFFGLPNPMMLDDAEATCFRKAGIFYGVIFTPSTPNSREQLTIIRNLGPSGGPRWPAAWDATVIMTNKSDQDNAQEPKIAHTSEYFHINATNNQEAVDKALEVLAALS